MTPSNLPDPEGYKRAFGETPNPTGAARQPNSEEPAKSASRLELKQILLYTVAGIVLFAAGFGALAVFSGGGSEPQGSGVDPAVVESRMIAEVNSEIEALRKEVKRAEDRVNALKREEQDLKSWYAREVQPPVAAAPRDVPRQEDERFRSGGGYGGGRRSPFSGFRGSSVRRADDRKPARRPLIAQVPMPAQPIGLQPSRLEKLKSAKVDLEIKLSSLKSQAEQINERLDKLRTQKESFEKFRKADIVFVQDGSHAVGVQAGSAGAMSVIGVADHPLSDAVRRQAARGKQKLIEDDGRLVRRLYQSGVGPLGADSAEVVRTKYWQPPRYVPTAAGNVMVSYVDLRDPEGRVKLGFELEPASDDAIRLATIEDRDLRLERRWARSGHCLRESLDNILDRSPGANFLDYAILRIAQSLSSDDPAIFHRVRVEVKADMAPSHFERLVSYRPRRYTSWSLRFLMDLDALQADKKNRFAEVDHQLQVVRKALEDEVYSRLNRLEIPTVERENLGAIQQEQELAGRSPSLRNRSLRSVDEQIDIARTLDEPVPIQALGSTKPASHVLVVEIGPGGSESELRMAVRLNETETSDMVFADDGVYSIINPAEPSDYMLASGRLVKLNDVSKNYVETQHPLRLSMPKSGKFPSSLMIMESEPDGQKMVRGLFSLKQTSLKAGNVDKAKSGYVKNWSDAPADNRMRYLAYEVVRHVKPQAGKVVGIEDRGGLITATVSYNRADQAFSVGDQVAASRPLRDDAYGGDAWLEELPLDLTVRNVSKNSLRCLLDTSGKHSVWSDEARLQKGDLVFDRRGIQPLVAIEDPRYLRPSNEVANKLNFDRAFKLEDDLADKAIEVGGKVADQLRKAMGELGVQVVVGNRLPEVAEYGATHVVRSTVEIATRNSFRVEFQVFRTGSNEVLVRLYEKIYEREIDNWRPEGSGREF